MALVCREKLLIGDDNDDDAIDTLDDATEDIDDDVRPT